MSWGGSRHIGKRSAAGKYCWDCGVTLCKAGADHVHESPACGISNIRLYIEESKKLWYERCPKCGRAEAKEELDTSAAGRELGFNENTPKKKMGVRGCASFTWDMPPDEFFKADMSEAAAIGKRPIEDEYGRGYSLEEFKQVLEECPIQFTDSIGCNFF